MTATACGGGRAVGQQGMARGDRYLISAAELREAGANNLYDAVVKLRPDFLRAKGNDLSAVPSPTSVRGNGDPAEASPSVGTAVAGTRMPVRAYHNDQMLSSVEELRQIPISSVVEVRFIPGPQAGVRYGTNHTGGVIHVRTQQ